MTLEVMQTPRHTLRAIFGISAVSTTFWMVALVWTAAVGENNVASVVVAPQVSAAVCWAAFRENRMALTSSLEVSELVRVLLPRIVGSYLIAVPIVGVVVWALTKLFGASEQRPGDATIVAIISAWWLPLWAAPAVGADWPWRSLRKRGAA
jgi:hypothetical protein